MFRPSDTHEFIDADVVVRYAETDQMGIVYNANYLVWFEVGRVAWCHAKGFRYRDMEKEDGHFLMVADARCRYLAPALFEDRILIRTRLKSANVRVVKFDYEVRNQENNLLLATGETVHVVADRSLRPARLPRKYYPVFGLGDRRASD